MKRTAETKKLLQSLRELRSFAASQIPSLQKEVSTLITQNEKDPQIIEALLDVLLSLIAMGVGQNPFNRLLQYYAGINPQNASHYQDLLAEACE